MCTAGEKQPIASWIGHEHEKKGPVSVREADADKGEGLPCGRLFVETCWPWTTRRPCAPAAYEAYRRLVVAVAEWDDYCAPQLEEPAEELRDQLGEESAPRALGEVLADVIAQLRKAARRAL